MDDLTLSSCYPKCNPNDVQNHKKMVRNLHHEKI